MNITQETNDYLSTTENWKDFVINYKFEKKYNSLGAIPSDFSTENNLKDKLKTTPNRGIKKISKVFRVNWGKVFKIK
jgi:hypothetical protein